MKYLYLVSIQPTTFYIWQLELWLHSFITHGNINPKDMVVVIHGHPDTGTASYLSAVLQRYRGLRTLWTEDHSKDTYLIRYKGPEKQQIVYPYGNKIHAIGDVWHRRTLHEYDYLVTTDPDMFIYGRLPVDTWPTTHSALTFNWESELRTFGQHGGLCMRRGIDLSKILEAIHIPQSNIERYCPGAIIGFLRSEDLNEQVMNITIAYLHIVHGLAYVAGDHRGKMESWICSEMVAIGLAFAHVGVDCEVSKNPATMPGLVSLDDPPENSIIHYPFVNPTFPGSNFNKYEYRSTTPIVSEALERDLANATTPHERSFYGQLLEIAHRYPDNRP